MNSWNSLAVLLLIQFLGASFEPHHSQTKANEWQSYIDIEGNKEYTYLFGSLINKEPEASTANKDNGLETGDQIMPDNSVNIEERKLVAEKIMLWPQRIVPYLISDNFENDAKGKIEEGIRRWEAVTCLKFIPFHEVNESEWKKLGHGNYLNIRNGAGCSSYAGFQQKLMGQWLNLNQVGCMRISTILHEIGHAIGFYHEQNRSDRDDYIEVHLENVKKAYQRNFDVFPSENIADYDYNSVMHYGRKYFSMNELDTMISKDQKLGFLLGNDEDVTFYDIKAANLAYGCDSACGIAKDLTCENDGFVNEQCTCYCPNVLEGEHCEKIAAALYNETVCESQVIELENKDTYNLIFPGNSYTYGEGLECAWLIKSPTGSNMTISVKLFDIPRNSRTHKCIHSLEIRYNLIGQYGPRLCGNTDHPVYLLSTSNIAMVILHAAVEGYSGRGFEVNFNIGQNGTICFPNPCKELRHVCHENGVGGYVCKCPSHLFGPDCSIIDHITCNFESKMGPEELCMFSQSEKDELDWITMEGSTASTGTGPEDDITGGGSYLYLEASAPVKTGNKAILTSAEISGGTKCFSFFYHMFGENMGKLQVLIHAGNKIYYAWLKSGDQGDQWNEVNLIIRMSKTYRIEIVAERGTGYKSDIAIDSVHLTNGVCKEGGELIDSTYQNCPEHYVGLNCDHVDYVSCNFDDPADNEGWCIFQNEADNDIDWQRNMDETESMFTGPSSDISGNGCYLYVDATEPAQENDVALMSTPFIKDGVLCVDFFYHMYGDEQLIGTFNVSFIDIQGNRHSFIASRNQGNTWHHYFVKVISKQIFKVVFQYTMGSGFRGDVAIDSFSIAHGPCVVETSEVNLPGDNDGPVVEDLVSME